MKSRIPMTHEAFKKLQQRAKVIERVIGGRITQLQAGIELGISDRQIRTLLKKYKEHGEEGLVHGLTGKPGNHHLKESDKKVIVAVVKLDDFKGCKPIFITEKLESEYGVDVSKETVRSIMTEEKKREPGTKKHHKHRIRRPRKEYYGEMSQFDGSYHDWLENEEERCLLLDIDDATGKIRHAKLCENEGYECVTQFWMESILLNGIPKNIYLDKFSTYKVNHPKAVVTKNVRTHFDKAIRTLGGNLISAHSPQAKGRVERCNRTLQDRLVWDLRLAKITTVNEANEFIKDVFISQFNKQFGVKAKKRGNVNRKLRKEEIENLEWTFAKKYLRSLGNDYIIQYNTNFYQVSDSKNYTVYPKKRLLVAEKLDGEIRIHAGKTCEEKIVNYKQINKYEVNRNRAKYRGARNKIEKERVKQAREQRKLKKYQQSKKRQNQYKAQKLIEKIQ